ncbi:hypothetical protein Bbelb_120640 [Branchiostoma belcheri]|nr:hypothetical protein Bbelb_120640 [Branchiostoma belcheri]
MAAAAPWSFGAQIHEELSCSICLELFTRPKVLPCQHTFCQDCLEVHAGKEGSFECPKCRQKTTLPSQGVAGLPDNSMAASMCETFQQQAALSTEVTANKCSVHNTEEVKLYCKQCQVPVCVLCLEKAHNGHSTTTIKNAIQESESSVQALINEGRNILESYGLMAEEKKLNAQKQQRDNGIIQAYNQMVQKLAKRRDQLLSESEKDHKKNLEEIQMRRKKLSADINELSAACDRAEQEMDKVGANLVRQETILKDVVEKYRGKAAPTPVQTQPAVFQPTDTPVPMLGHVTVGDTRDQKQGKDQPDTVTFGRSGSGKGQFRDPVGIAVSDEGEIFEADRGNQRIQVFTLQGTFVRQFQTNLQKPGWYTMDPTDVALDGDGNPWVVGRTGFDTSNFAVKYSKRGRAVTQIDLQKAGWDRGVAVDTRMNNILITQTTGELDKDNLQSEVLVFRPNGTLVRTVRGVGTSWLASLFWQQRVQMKHPRYIAVDREGNIVVSDRDSNHVFVYNEYGQFLFSFGGFVNNVEGSDLNKPSGICTDREGNIIVVDTENCCLKIFDKRGKFLKYVVKDMEKPWAVAMATQGPLVVTDGGTNTVTVFNKT